MKNAQFYNNINIPVVFVMEQRTYQLYTVQYQWSVMYSTVMYSTNVSHNSIPLIYPGTSEVHHFNTVTD